MRWFLGLLAVAVTLPAQIRFRADGASSGNDRAIGAKLGDIVSVKDPHGSTPGAVGDGATDDTAAIQAAITAGAGGIVDFPAPSVSYKVTGTLTVSTAGTTLRGNNSKIYMAHTDSGPSGGILLSITASNVEVNGLWIDSTGTSISSVTINHYGIKIVGSSGTHLTNVGVRNCRLTALPWTYYPPSGVGAPFATHAIYAQYVDGFTAQNNKVDTVGGAAVFMSVVTKANILDNDINSTGWYSIQFNDQVDGALVRGNRITGTGATDRLWGGSVNLMSNSTTGGACGTPGCARIKRAEIAYNYISGAHSYTAAVHIESSSYVSFHHNIMESIYLTQPSDFYSNPTPPDYVRIYVRPVLPGTTNEGANDHIDISDNLMIANGIQGIAIYADAQDNGSGTLGYSDTLMVTRNRIVSLDTSNYWQHAVIVHGQQGGWKNLAFLNNQITGFPDASSPVSGLIGTVALVAAPLLDVQIVGNNVGVVGGVSSTTTHLGIALDAYTTRAIVTENILTNLWDGIRSFTNAATLYVWGNNFNSSGHNDYTQGVAFLPPVFPVPIAVASGGTGSATQNFVDLSTAQAAIAGAKTFTGGVSDVTTAASSTAETILTLGVSDVATNQGYFIFKNGSATDADFYPFFDLGSKGTNPGITTRSSIVTDSGTNGAFEYNARTTVPAALATRPLWALQNNGTRVISISSAVPGAILQVGVTQANLGTPANGTIIYCSDCTIANPCAGSGTGALAKRLNGVWVCN